MKTNIKIGNTRCMCCDSPFAGKDKKKTEHHSVPRRMKPRHNIIINICEACHKKLHSYDSHNKA